MRIQFLSFCVLLVARVSPAKSAKVTKLPVQVADVLAALRYSTMVSGNQPQGHHRGRELFGNSVGSDADGGDIEGYMNVGLEMVTFEPPCLDRCLKDHIRRQRYVFGLRNSTNSLLRDPYTQQVIYDARSAAGTHQPTASNAFNLVTAALGGTCQSTFLFAKCMLADGCWPTLSCPNHMKQIVNGTTRVCAVNMRYNILGQEYDVFESFPECKDGVTDSCLDSATKDSLVQLATADMRQSCLAQGCANSTCDPAALPMPSLVTGLFVITTWLWHL